MEEDIDIKLGDNEDEILAYIRQFDNLYVYGAGAIGKVVVHDLIERGCVVESIIVSQKERNPDMIEEVPVKALKDIQPNDKNVIVLGVSDKYVEQIKGLLKEKGYRNIIKLETPYIFRGVMTANMRAKLPKLEITAQVGCKVQCHFCPQRQLLEAYFSKDKQRKSELCLQDYKNCILRMPQNTIISFAGYGEPFHHPHAVEMMLFAHEMGYKIELFTTLDGLTIEKFKCIEDIPFVFVVLHTPDKKHYANIHTTQEYWEIVDRALGKKKANGMNFIDMANCQSEPTEEFLHMARNRVHVYTENLNNRAGNLESDKRLRESIYRTGGIYCRRSSRQNQWVLLPDGTVTLCCMDFGLRHPLGNLLKNSYEEILSGEPYLCIRRMMQNMEDSGELICRKCVEAVSIV